MAVSIAHLGPIGTYSEAAALTHASWLTQKSGSEAILYPYPSISQTLRAVSQGEVQLAVAPVENSIEGSVPMTLDMLWKLDRLQIQQAYILPISHALLSRAGNQKAISTVYSHPQALAQCRGWLETFLPSVRLIPTNSTTEAVRTADKLPTAAAIASQRAAELYQMPILAYPINDHPENCTRFWVLSSQPSPGGSHTSLAFSVGANVPGSLVKPLQVFASRDINLSRIESRPTKRSLGDYLFFIDLEANATHPSIQIALAELKSHTGILKIFGSYDILLAKPEQIDDGSN